MDEQNRRSEPRDSVYFRANVPKDAVELQVTVRNVSPHGAMIQGAKRIAVGAELALELNNIGIVHGTVAWVDGDSCGMQFNEPIDHHLARRKVTSEVTSRASLFVLPPKRPV